MSDARKSAANNSDTDNDDKVAVVTGAAVGLGQGIARRLAEDGFAVVLQDINADALDKTREEFERRGFRVAGIVGDVSKKEDQEATVQAAVDSFGHLDVFVSNAGITSVKPFLQITEEEMSKVFSVNVFGTAVFATQAAAEQFIRQGTRGKVIIACSDSGEMTAPYLGTYSASKFAVKAFVQTAAQELAAHGITVNCYCPGVSPTPMWHKIDADMMKADPSLKPGDAYRKFTSQIALGRPETPEDVAGVVSFLASSDADYITGQSLIVDGGFVYR